MDDLEIEALLSSLDELRSTPEDVAARIHTRVLDEARSMPEDVVALIDEPVRGEPVLVPAAVTTTGRSPRRWVLVACAAAAVALVVFGVASLRDGAQETVVSGVTLESACLQLAELTDDFALFSTAVGVEPWTAEDLAVVRPAVHDVVQQLRSDAASATDVAAWFEFELFVAQADRDASVGDLVAARRVLTQVQLRWAEIEQTSPPACRPG